MPTRRACLQNYPPLLKDWENFYTRRLYHRIQDCWNRPIVGPPRAGCTNVIERVTHDGSRSWVYVDILPRGAHSIPFLLSLTLFKHTASNSTATPKR